MPSAAFERLITQMNAKGRIAGEGYSLDMIEDIPDEERKEAEDLVVSKFASGDNLIAYLIPHLKYYNGEELLISELVKSPLPSYRNIKLCFALSPNQITEPIYQLLYQNYLLDKYDRSLIIGILLDYTPSYDLLCFFEKLYEISTAENKGVILTGIFYCCGIIKDILNTQELKSISEQKKIILESDAETVKKYFVELNEKYYPEESKNQTSAASEETNLELRRIVDYKLGLFKSSKEANTKLQAEALYEKKAPHSTSYPVIHEENGDYYLAAFVFFFTANDIREGMVDRPIYWVLADIKTGELLQRYNTKDKEFSAAQYDVKYDIKSSDKKYDISKSYYEEAFAILDEVRTEIIYSNQFDNDKYQEYLNKILASTPADYQRFYLDLSV